MASFLERLLLPAPRESAKPKKEQGKAGYAIVGGVITTNETNYQLIGQHRWRTATDMLSNISIVAASLRYFLNLIARPSWHAEPVDDTAAAKAAAEFVEMILDDIDTSWTRIVRRSGMYRFHGFHLNEWVAKDRPDGKIGIASVEPRPGHTIENWDVDENGTVIGVWQRNPQDGKLLYMPRAKLVYLVDDTLTDRPDGMGWFRNLVEPANRIKRYLKLEGMGYQRDLVGIPVGRMPMNEINAMVEAGDLTIEQAKEMQNGLKDFCKLESKVDNTGIILDSSLWIAKSETGESISSTYQWGVELLKGEAGPGLEKLGEAVRRLEFEMALVMGCSSMLTGREGEGSRALSEDQSRNLYLTANATLSDMAEAFDRDIVGPLWAMNGLPDELKPKLRTEDASFKDAEKISAVLRDLATAGALLAPDDPAINDLRDLLGISAAEPMDIETLAAIRGDQPKEPEDDKGGGGPPGKGPKSGEGRARKYDPDQPRDPAGSETGGQWTSAVRQHTAGDEYFASAIDQYLENPEKFVRGPTGQTREQVEEHLAQFEEAFKEQKLDKDRPLYRGMVMSSELGDLEAAQERGYIEFKKPVSFSGDVTTARDYAASEAYLTGEPDLDAQLSPVILVHEGRKGDPAIHADPISGDDLKEYILPRGRFNITRVHDAGSKSGDHPLLWVYGSFRPPAVPPRRELDKAFNPNQPRDPAGTPTGGRWTGHGGGGGLAMSDVVAAESREDIAGSTDDGYSNPYIRALHDKMGWNTGVRVASEDEIANATPVYRGFNDLEHAEAYEAGPSGIGGGTNLMGAKGSGHYYALDRRVSEAYTGGNEGRIAEHYLAPDAKILTLSENHTWFDAMRGWQSEYLAAGGTQKKFDNLRLAELSYVAAHHGYDAVRYADAFDGEAVLVFNKAKLMRRRP